VDNIYIFSAASVQQAITSGTALTFAQATTVIDNSGNSDLALSGSDLFQTFTSPSSFTTTLEEYNLANPSAAPTVIGTDPNSSDFFTALRTLNGNLYLDDTDGSSFTDLIEISPAAIPEPGAQWFVGAGLLLTGIVYKRRRHASKTTV
jgi:hypothetical protein